MELKRLVDIPYPLKHSVRNAQSRGRLKKYIDEDGYLCVNLDELTEYKKTRKKCGRPIKIMEEQK